MDVQMPEMDGYEAAASIRKTEETTLKRVRFWRWTAHAMKGDRKSVWPPEWMATCPSRFAPTISARRSKNWCRPEAGGRARGQGSPQSW